MRLEEEQFMLFAASVIFLLLYFLRPQDTIPALSGFNIVRPVMMIGLAALAFRTRRRREAPPLPFLRTPHEWVMLVYFLYILLTSPDGFGIFSEVFALASFFVIAMQGINNPRRLTLFLRWWRWALIVIVVMGLGVVYGFDFTNSADATARMSGRLCLRNWILDNPNALGHTLVTLLPLLYFGLFRDHSPGKKIQALLLAVPLCICLWHTQSKGAYLVGASVMVLAIVLGRSLWWKIGVLCIAMGGGQAALSTLPRMTNVEGLRTDEGVMGRLMAWEIARNVTKQKLTGEGWKHFGAVIKWEGQEINKATHSAYVKIGADLGEIGLLLYLSLLCCGFRTLLTYRGSSPSMEQSRRILLCLLVCYAGSGWMIDRSYHTEFFLLLGAIAAYQSLCVRALTEKAKTVATATALVPPVHQAAFGNRRRPMLRSPGFRRVFEWRKYGLLDVGLACGALQVVLSTWDYILQTL